MYITICLLFAGAGSAMLYAFPYEQNPGKTVLAIVLIAVGLFLFVFRRRGAGDVKDAAEALNNPFWPWW